MVQQKQKCVVTSAGSESTGKRKITVGSVWESKSYGKFKIVEYFDYYNVKVKFLFTGFVTRANSSSIRAGSVKDKLLPSVHGVGFVGDGEFRPSHNGMHTKPYILWICMLQRCYSHKCSIKNPTYKDCTVCDEWHNYQNFASWYKENYPTDGKCYQLDKDMKVIGNKVYSPDTCMFVSQVVNVFTIDAGASRGDCLIGVSWHKVKGKFISRCNNPITGKVEQLGAFNTELSAHTAWRERKSELAYELAMVQGREEVKQALLNWKEALDNNLIHPY